ncbi:MAG: hypothetical protein QG630_96 [Patescibacteria group bacterium]|nr:hypothetical protein [Patescibacteria group bacterium]
MQDSDKSFFQKIESYFSKTELKNRAYLSKRKFLYALLGGAGVVLYWRGIWHSADILEIKGGLILKIIFSPVGSIILGILLLSSIGLLVQAFIGADVIISGIKKEKQEIDKTEEELKKDEEAREKEKNLIKEIDEHLHSLQKEMNEDKKIKS